LATMVTGKQPIEQGCPHPTDMQKPCGTGCETNFDGLTH
jgi:hypothetical protein